MTRPTLMDETVAAATQAYGPLRSGTSAPIAHHGSVPSLAGRACPSLRLPLIPQIRIFQTREYYPATAPVANVSRPCLFNLPKESIPIRDVFLLE